MLCCLRLLLAKFRAQRWSSCGNQGAGGPGLYRFRHA